MMKGRMLVLALILLFASGLAVAGPLDINSADAASIVATMKGVGMSKAEAIVEYRKAHGPFASIEDLTRVKGIGPATVERNRDHLVALPPGAKKAASK